MTLKNMNIKIIIIFIILIYSFQSCASNQYLTREKCSWYESCSYKNHRCHDCPVNCSTCSNANQCDSCYYPYVLIDRQCIKHTLCANFSKIIINQTNDIEGSDEYLFQVTREDQSTQTLGIIELSQSQTYKKFNLQTKCNNDEQIYTKCVEKDMCGDSWDQEFITCRQTSGIQTLSFSISNKGQQMTKEGCLKAAEDYNQCNFNTEGYSNQTSLCKKSEFSKQKCDKLLGDRDITATIQYSIEFIPEVNCQQFCHGYSDEPCIDDIIQISDECTKPIQCGQNYTKVDDQCLCQSPYEEKYGKCDIFEEEKENEPIQCGQNYTKVDDQCLCQSPYEEKYGKCDNFEEDGENDDCPQYCAQCKSDGKCKKCEYNFSLENDDCNCNDPYKLVNDKCLDKNECPSNCEKCDEYQECVECQENFSIFLGKCIEDNQKIECPINCWWCEDSYSCSVCKRGYSLSDDGICFTTEGCQDGCEKCLEPFKCLECSLYHILDLETFQCFISSSSILIYETIVLSLLVIILF